MELRYTKYGGTRTSTEGTECMSWVFMVNNSVLRYVVTKRFHTFHTRPESSSKPFRRQFKSKSVSNLGRLPIDPVSRYLAINLLIPLPPAVRPSAWKKCGIVGGLYPWLKW